jgi:hypothetical protein
LAEQGQQQAKVLFAASQLGSNAGGSLLRADHLPARDNNQRTVW